LQTGKSKHYGFIEFDSASVAKIVAETMDNYLLNGHIMQCKVIPKDKVHPQLWVGANRKWRTVPPEQLTRAKHNKVRLVSPLRKQRDVNGSESCRNATTTSSTPPVDD
jgi:nucleolar protein 15